MSNLNIGIAIGFFAILLCLPLSGAEAVTAKVSKIIESPSKSLVTIELFNGLSKGLKSYRAMLVFKNADGKVVDVQSRWLLGSEIQTDDEKSTVIPPVSKSEINLALTAKQPFRKIEIISTRLILEDDTVISPPPSGSIRNPLSR